MLSNYIRTLTLAQAGRLAVAGGDDDVCDPSPAMGDDGRYFVFEGAKLKLVILTPGAGMVRLGGNQVAADEQLVAFDAGVVVDGPLIIFGNLVEYWTQTTKRLSSTSA